MQLIWSEKSYQNKAGKTVNLNIKLYWFSSRIKSRLKLVCRTVKILCLQFLNPLHWHFSLRKQTKFEFPEKIFFFFQIFLTKVILKRNVPTVLNDGKTNFSHSIDHYLRLKFIETQIAVIECGKNCNWREEPKLNRSPFYSNVKARYAMCEMEFLNYEKLK